MDDKPQVFKQILFDMIARVELNEHIFVYEKKEVISMI